ncbi:MAG TPA: hypothetical protein VK444_04405 [Methanobacteriaceae archaeon]|nr:hypothetical protein [Methanobacteriaceae archaeon]
MKKLAILGIMALMVGMVPAYAADTNTTHHTGKHQLNGHHKHQFNNATGYQCNKIGHWKNSQIAAKIEALKTSDPAKYQQIQDLKTQIQTLKQQIHTLRQQNNTATQIQQLRNQIKDKRNQILKLLGL